MTPEEIAACQTSLTNARAALSTAILTGQLVEVKNEFTSTRYQPASVADLRQYIAELESQCGCTNGGSRRPPFGVRW